MIEFYWNGQRLERSYCVFEAEDKLEIRYVAHDRAAVRVEVGRFGRFRDASWAPRRINLLEWCIAVPLAELRRSSLELRAEGAQIWLLSKWSVVWAWSIFAAGAAIVAWRLAHFYHYMHPGPYTRAYQLFLAMIMLAQSAPVLRLFLPSEKELPLWGVVHLWNRALLTAAAGIVFVFAGPRLLFTAVQNETPHALLLENGDDDVKLGPGELTILPAREPRSSAFYAHHLRPAEVKRGRPAEPGASARFAEVREPKDAYQNYCLHGISEDAGGCRSHPEGDYDPETSFYLIPRVAVRCRGTTWPLAEGLLPSPRRGVVHHGEIWLAVNPDDCSADPSQAEVAVRLAPSSDGGTELSGSLLAGDLKGGTLLLRYPASGGERDAADGGGPHDSPMGVTRFEMPLDGRRGVQSIAFSSKQETVRLGDAARQSIGVSMGLERGERPLEPQGSLSCQRPAPRAFSIVRVRVDDSVERLRITKAGCAGAWSDWRRAAGSPPAEFAWACDLREDCSPEGALTATVTMKRDQEPSGVVLTAPAGLPIAAIDLWIEVDGQKYTFGRLQCSGREGSLEARPVRVFAQQILAADAEELALSFAAPEAGSAASAEARLVPARSTFTRDPTWSALAARVPGWKSPWACQPIQRPPKITRLVVGGAAVEDRARIVGDDVRLTPPSPRACYLYFDDDQSVPSWCASAQRCCLARYDANKGCDEVWRCDCRGKQRPRCE